MWKVQLEENAVRRLMGLDTRVRELVTRATCEELRLPHYEHHRLLRALADGLLAADWRRRGA